MAREGRTGVRHAKRIFHRDRTDVSVAEYAEGTLVRVAVGDGGVIVWATRKGGSVRVSNVAFDRTRTRMSLDLSTMSAVDIALPGEPYRRYRREPK